MSNIILNFKKSKITGKEIMEYSEEIEKIHILMNKKANSKDEFLGWLNWPTKYDKKEFEKIKKCAKRIQENSEVLIVIGIGGSYLGARAVIEALKSSFYNMQDKSTRKFPQIFYVGNNLSSTYINDLIELIQDKDFSINVISKSGTTTEPAIAFRIFRNLLEDKYGIGEAQKRIYVTTDKEKGALKQLANEEGYETFVIPDNIGGRYSVLTPVGLLPIAVAGIDIDALMKGLHDGMGEYGDADLEKNAAYRYAVARRILQNQGYDVELLVNYEPQMQMVAEWWKQLFGESEGKDGKGILPDSVCFSTDLHSLGQFVQEGKKVLFETNLYVEKPMIDLTFPNDEANEDGMNYLAGKSVDWANKMAAKGTLQAHEETGGVPNILLTMPGMTSYDFGNMCMFFFKAIAMTTLMNDSNPFNQPGVEVYKKNMFKLLGKE